MDCSKVLLGNKKQKLCDMTCSTVTGYIFTKTITNLRNRSVCAVAVRQFLVTNVSIKN